VSSRRGSLIRLFKTLIFFPVETLYFFLLPFRKLISKSKTNTGSRFVFVISFPRSGTTALGSLLQQPSAEINYHGEFFALNHWNKTLREISKFYPFFMRRYFVGYLLQKRKWRYYQFEHLKLNPDKALSALAKVPGTHVFKIFPFHIYDQSLEAAIKKYKPDILFLRRNHLDRLVSHKKAMATGVWHGVSTASVEVEIDEKQLNKYMADYQNFYQKMKLCADSISAKVLDVEYETLFNPGNIEMVMEFILADPKKVANLNVKPRTLKQDASDASQQTFLQKISSNGVKKEISDFNFHRISK
jgi:LPS sulfotransferase NodH